ncbi:GNAT family N-acetyltransferase [Jannaschia sp. 2305UL9-9]|uniref:GNAT family N-acetyltransferase n=1 Tax=Jannaschia sp. 2305UL9-9 TaxID=3121638 RepID=UPI0035282576
MTGTTVHIPTLTTERLMLRAPRVQDADAFAAFYASPRASFVGGPLSAERAWRSMAQEAGHWVLRGYGRWVLEEHATGKAVGCVGLWFPEGFPERELGWDLFEGATGKGYATEAGRAARDYAYDVLGWTTVISLIADGNDGSVGVAKRLGATLDGTFPHDHFGPTQIWRHPAPKVRA